jgi:hypothetical protein
MRLRKFCAAVASLGHRRFLRGRCIGREGPARDANVVVPYTTNFPESMRAPPTAPIFSSFTPDSTETAFAQ